MGAVPIANAVWRSPSIDRRGGPFRFQSAHTFTLPTAALRISFKSISCPAARESIARGEKHKRIKLAITLRPENEYRRSQSSFIRVRGENAQKGVLQVNVYDERRDDKIISGRELAICILVTGRTNAHGSILEGSKRERVRAAREGEGARAEDDFSSSC